MKSFIRIAAVMLILAQLFAISASAAFTASDLEQMNTALDEANTQPSGAQEGSAAAENAEREAQEREAEEAAAAAEAAREAARASTKIDYEIAPVTKFGSPEDVMIGGLLIQPGVWYTVDSEGVLTSAEAWPNSYLYYSASQSKLTLHEFHYRVPTDTIGKEHTYAALYLPKDIHLVLEGENELINNSYTTAGGGVSNGVYAPDHHISIEGNGTLYVNTNSSGSYKGYGIQAGSIRIDSDFTGLAVFGMTSAFSCAPSVAEARGAATSIAGYFPGYKDIVNTSEDLARLGSKYGFEVPDLAAEFAAAAAVPQGREMIANVADLHPQYNEGVHVREASPYDQSIFTRFRYVLFAVGKGLSWEQEMKAKIEAEYYRSKMEYNLAVDQGYAEAYDSFTTEAYNGFVEFGDAMAQEYGEIYNQGVEMGFGPDWMQGTPENPGSSDPLTAYVDSINQQYSTEIENAGSQLWEMLMGSN